MTNQNNKREPIKIITPVFLSRFKKAPITIRELEVMRKAGYKFLYIDLNNEIEYENNRPNNRQVS